LAGYIWRSNQDRNILLKVSCKRLMDTKLYQSMAYDQDRHWWFMARRKIISSVIDTIGLPKNSRILEIGCGPGGNLRMLKQYGLVEAIEKDKFSREYARRLTGIIVQEGSLPDDVDKLENKFDLICLFDVLEHIEQDIQALTAIRTLLRNSGTLLITVPAHQWLYGPHDMTHHHFRRYSQKDVAKKSTEARFSIRKIGYFNFLLFPLFLIFRIIDKISSKPELIGNNIPSSLINTILYGIFSIEKYMLNFIALPFGASIIAILEKEQGAYP